MAYFERLSPTAFRATEHTGGAWREDEQHVAASLGLLAHIVELDRDERRSDTSVLTRLSFDILGTMPVGDVETTVRVLRPGRTIELVEARMSHDGRDAVVLRAWLQTTGDTTGVAGTSIAPLPAPGEFPEWSPTAAWPGGFIESVTVHRNHIEPGRARFWARTNTPLVDEPHSRLAASVGLFDIANGMAVREDPERVHFPNLDLTAHLHRSPVDDWVGFDTTVTFSADGVGLTSSVLHDVEGPIGSLNQILTVRPGRPDRPA
jgi:hypothetical protein